MNDVQDDVISFDLEVNVIGWCVQDGEKKLITDTGCVVDPVFGHCFLNGKLESVEDAIELCKEEASKTGLLFPEFIWNGHYWEEVKTDE